MDDRPLERSRVKVGELATLMLVVAILAEGFQLVMADPDRQTRALGISAVALIAFVIGLRSGRHLYRRERIHSVGWLPKNVTWHLDESGARHAIVTQNSGDVVSIPIPGHVSADDAMTYVLVQLNEGRSRAGSS